MNTEYLGGNYGGNRKAVKNVDESLPRLDITASFTFIVEAVYCKRLVKSKLHQGSWFWTHLV